MLDPDARRRWVPALWMATIAAPKTMRKIQRHRKLPCLPRRNAGPTSSMGVIILAEISTHISIQTSVGRPTPIRIERRHGLGDSCRIGAEILLVNIA